MQNPVTLRFIEVYKFLVFNNVINSARQFAMSLDFFPQSLNDILKGRRDVTIELVRKAVEVYQINSHFLFMGEGPILVSSMPTECPSELNVKVPFVGISDIGTYPTQVDSVTYIESLSYYSFCYPIERNEEYRAFEMPNDQLKPSISKGEVLISKKISPSDWASKILDGFIYIFVTDNGVEIERVLNFLKDNGTILLKSNLAEISDHLTLNILEIKEVWEIKSRLTSDIPNPNNYKYRTDQRLETVSTILEKQSESISSLHSTINRLLKQNREYR